VRENVVHEFRQKYNRKIEAMTADVSDVKVVLTTWPADRDAEPFARTLVEERLAACVNILPEMLSVYTWKGSVERAAERQVVIKTTRARLDALAARVASLHPYDVPELLVLDVAGGSEAYLRWVGETGARG
jgi:periplasmic divalent cation tolerance protein